LPVDDDDEVFDDFDVSACKASSAVVAAVRAASMFKLLISGRVRREFPEPSGASAVPAKKS
jgi:hypothetical protein